MPTLPMADPVTLRATMTAVAAAAAAPPGSAGSGAAVPDSVSRAGAAAGSRRGIPSRQGGSHRRPQPGESTASKLSDSYLRGERNRLLSLWRQVVTFRCHFLNMKTATDRDLSELKAEQMRLSGSVLVNCSRLNSGVQLWEPVSLGRPVLKDQAQQQAEQETSQKTWEVMHLQVKGDLEKKELQDRVMELSALHVQSQKQNEEKEKTMKTLKDTVEILEASLLEKEYEPSLTKSVKEENLSLQKLIKDITGPRRRAL
ncbi:centrosome-associated protein CEP250-like isoform X1 [Strix uralensis]|uniref:centrosome-associated protein CEP250-like isoform X1 n=1 Tax=Strix uralensis TaxID=36305 RepID=UPI003DA729B4